MEFSPTLRPKPDSFFNDSTEESTSSLKDMEVNISNQSEKSQISSVEMTAALEDKNSELISSELKSLRATIHQLVEQNKNADSTTSIQQLQKLDLEAKKRLFQAESLSQANAKLEESNQRLTSEREELIAKASRLETELATSNGKTNTQIEHLEEAKKNLEVKLVDMSEEKATLKVQVSRLESEINDMKRAVEQGKLMSNTLKDEFQTEKFAMESNQKLLTETNLKLSRELKLIKSTNESFNETIQAYEDKIASLENDLLPESEAQLKEALANIKQLEKAALESKIHMAQYDLEIQNLKAAVGALKKEKEEERKNFQALNEASSQAYEEMMNDVSQKQSTIDQLKKQLTLTEEKLSLQSNKVLELTSKMEKLKSKMDSKIADLQESLDASMQQVEDYTSKNQALEKELQEANEKITKDEAYLEEMLSASKEKSVALEDSDKMRVMMQKRIQELEQRLKNTIEEKNYAQERMATFNEREEALFQKLRNSDRVRRDLHNRVMQLSGNIRVYVRVRPALPGELEKMKKAAKPAPTKGQKRKHAEMEEETTPFSFPGQLSGLDERLSKKSKMSFGADDPTKNILEVREPHKDRGGLSERRKKWTFGFDHIFDPTHGQEDVWEATEPLIQSAIDGFNVTIFAYGQTGSGKTHTMLGDVGNEGIISRAVAKLFDAKTEIEDLSRGEKSVSLSVELLEVYNEKVRDLLAPNSGPEGQEIALKISANEAVGSKIVPVADTQEVHKILNIAQKRRCVKATASNAVSSRSHMIFTINFEVSSKNGASRVGKLHVCDLAGSERLSKSNANQVGGSLLRETKHINTSLSVLSNVIEKLQAGDKNVPYRESKLTYLLQNSLGGNSKTLAIVCCNPLQSHFHESLCSLRFAAKVNKVDLKAMANFSC